MRLWVLPQSPATPCFPLRALSFGSSSGVCAWSTQAPLRVQFQLAAACAEPGGCRDTALCTRPVAPVRSHIVAGSVAAAPRCRRNLSASSTLLFGQTEVFYLQQPHLSSSLLLFVSKGAFWHRLSSQKAPAGSSMRATFSCPLALLDSR